MLSPIGRNALFSCSRFNTKINDLSKLTVTQMRRHQSCAPTNWWSAAALGGLITGGGGAPRIFYRRRWRRRRQTG